MQENDTRGVVHATNDPNIFQGSSFKVKVECDLQAYRWCNGAMSSAQSFPCVFGRPCGYLTPAMIAEKAGYTILPAAAVVDRNGVPVRRAVYSLPPVEEPVFVDNRDVLIGHTSKDDATVEASTFSQVGYRRTRRKLGSPLSIYLNDSIAAMKHLNASVLHQQLGTLARTIAQRIRAGGTIFAAGNGGSAAIAAHFVGELVGRFDRDRSPWPAILLGGDPATTSAISNDFGAERVFSRQLRALARPGDLVIAWSTSGQSTNIVDLLETARKLQLTSALFTGAAANTAITPTWTVKVPVLRTSHIQELHACMMHAICIQLEGLLCDRQATRDRTSRY